MSIAHSPTVAEMQVEVDAARTTRAVSRLLLQALPAPTLTPVTWAEARALIALGIEVQERQAWGELHFYADETDPTVRKLIYEPESVR